MIWRAPSKFKSVQRYLEDGSLYVDSQQFLEILGNLRIIDQMVHQKGFATSGHLWQPPSGRFPFDVWVNYNCFAVYGELGESLPSIRSIERQYKGSMSGDTGSLDVHGNG